MFLRVLTWVWRHRERPALGSSRWCKTWAKRLVGLPELLKALWRLERLARQGATLGLPVLVSPCVWNGKVALIEIGEGSFVGRVELHLHDRVRIGRYVVINDGVRLLTGSHDINDPDFRLVAAPIVIGDYAWIGAGAILLPGATVGTGAVIGAGAVVAKDVPDYSVAVGNPARVLSRTRTRNLRYQPLHLVASFEAWIGRAKGADTPRGEVRRDNQVSASQ